MCLPAAADVRFNDLRHVTSASREPYSERNPCRKVHVPPGSPVDRAFSWKERIMPTSETFIKRHPVLSYYVLAFAISWGAMLLVIGGPVGIPATPEQMVRMMGPVVAALMAGPSVAGLLLTGIVDGRAGLRELFSRLLQVAGRGRAGTRWRSWPPRSSRRRYSLRSRSPPRCSSRPSSLRATRHRYWCSA